jgi:hypothetical protein
MKTITKGLVGTVAAGAMVLGSASPAFARDHDRGGVSAGDVIAGALIIGGIAAIATAASNSDRDRYDVRYDGGYGNGYDNGYYDRRGYDDRYGNAYGYNSNPRQAVQLCVNAAERQASRYSYGGRANVTDIRDIDRTNGGFTVRGRIAVNQLGRNWRNGDGNYGRGWNSDYRGWNNGLRGYDSGSFTCKVRFGRVVDVDINGIRGL